MDKIKIYLTKDEKTIIRHIKEYGKETPKNFSQVMFHYILSSLRDKGLVVYKSNYDDIYSVKFTIKGAALLESNPELHNPIDWVKWISLGAVTITAIATSLSLFL